MLQIKEAKRTFFKSKEHYLDFLAAWKKAANQEDKALRPSPYHYIIYALLRGYHEDHGFTPITSENKLKNGRRSDQAEHSARLQIIWAARTHIKYSTMTPSKVENFLTSMLGKKPEPPKIQNIWMEKLKEPFGDTISNEYLAIIGSMLETYTGPGLVQEFAPIFDVQEQVHV